jgi:hypothetical protein
MQAVHQCAPAVHQSVFTCRNLQLEFDVHLRGPRSATHLSGRQRVFRGKDLADDERWRALLWQQHTGQCQGGEL